MTTTHKRGTKSAAKTTATEGKTSPKRKPDLKARFARKEPKTRAGSLHEYLHGIPGDGTPVDGMESEIRSSRFTLALHALEEALPSADHYRMLRFGGAGVIIAVPSPEWIPAMRMAAESLCSWHHVFCRSGSSKTVDRPDVGCMETADFLGVGGRVLGISQAPTQYLPSALVSAADVRIRIGTPSDAVIRKTILTLTGNKVRRMPPDIARGLSFDVIAASIRRGTLASSCVNRLVAASKANAAVDPDVADVPLLSEIHGYGRAGEYAQRLAYDFSEWKAGRLEWSALERSVLLAGEPGTGKTTLVRSIAKTLGIPLINTSVAGWFASTNGYLNEIIKEINRVFLLASQMSPVIVFADELNALPNRMNLGSRNRDYWMPLINHCLTTFEATISGNNGKIILIGATNFPDLVDPALLRPGRLGRVITVEKPDAEGLAGIIRQHLGPDVLDGADLSVPATLGVGATGAQVTAWVAGARRRARDAERPMRLDDLVRAIAPPDPRSPEEALSCARHESGHSLACTLLGVGTVISMSNVMRSGQGGLTTTQMSLATTLTRTAIEDYVVSVLAGRAADEAFGDANSGAGGAYASDLGLATGMLASMHLSLGLGGSLLHRASDAEARDCLRHSPEMARKVEADLVRLYARACELIEENRDLVEVLAQRLVVARIMTGDQVRAVIAQHRPKATIIQTLGSNHG